MSVDLETAPILLLDAGLIDDESVWLLGVTVYGRLVVAVVPWWNSTPAGIDAALRAAWAEACERELDRAGALASYAAEASEPYEMADDGPGL